MQQQRMRQQNVARLARHFDDPNIDAVDHRCISHQSIHSIARLIPRTEFLHPHVLRYQRTARISRPEALRPRYAKEILD